MDASEVQKLLISLGCGKIKVGTKWIYSDCPLAKWRHRDGLDRHPSFSTLVAPNDLSRYTCHACKASGDVIQLIHRIKSQPGGKVSPEIEKFVIDTNTPSLDKTRDRLKKLDYDNKPVSLAGIQVAPDTVPKYLEDFEITYIEEEVLEDFRNIPEDVSTYLREDRRISQRAVEEWEVGWVPKSSRVVIPVRDIEGRIVSLSGRYFGDGNKTKWMHTKGFRKEMYLFGENKIDSSHKVGYLAEGMFDVIYLWDKGYTNSVAMMGSHLSKLQEEKLVRFFDEVVIVTDGDPAGYEATERIGNSLSRRCHVRCPVMPEGKDPDHLSSEELEELLGPPPVDRETS